MRRAAAGARGRTPLASVLLTALALAARGALGQTCKSNPHCGAVDPETYPAPSRPSNPTTSCGTLPRCSTSGCPHCSAGLKLWNAAATWPGGKVPVAAASSDVTLPNSTRVLISGCMLAGGAQFRRITVPETSELVFDDAPTNLTVAGIYVYGKLSMGSPTCRLASNIAVTFANDVSTSGVTLSDTALKVYSAGVADIHGALFTPTWTRLAATANPNATSVTLQVAVNWRVGQMVVITTSLWKDECRNQNEVRTISAISADGKTVTFTQPLQFRHYGGAEYQSEVILISRNILFQGSVQMASLKAGGHTRVEGKGRIRGVMTYRMGQLGVMSSYPFHYHFAGDASDMSSYITDCSVYRSYWRAYTIHATNGLLVQHNTAFHVQGNAFYLEDGVEERNTLDGNAAAFVHPLGRKDNCKSEGSIFGPHEVLQNDTIGLLQPADWAASGFYISNPYNFITNNAASGGVAGFTFLRLYRPTGMSRYTQGIVPYQRPVGRFEGNTAHSTGYQFDQACGVYIGGSLTYTGPSNLTLRYSVERTEMDTRDLQGQPTKFVLNQTKVWLAGFSITTYGTRMRVDGWESYDGVRGVNIRGETSEATDTLINLNTANAWWLSTTLPDDLQPSSRFGFLPYDVFYRHILNNVTFRNIRSDVRQAAILANTLSDIYKPGHMTTLGGIKFENTSQAAGLYTPSYTSGAWRSFNFLDSDGSFTQSSRPTLVAAYSPTNDTSANCKASSCPAPFNRFAWWISDDAVGKCSTTTPFGDKWSSVLCDWYPWRTPARLEFSIPGYTATGDAAESISQKNSNLFDAGLVAQFGYTGNAIRSSVLTRAEGVTGLTGSGGWYVHWSLGAPKFIQVHMHTVPRGTSVVYATRYPRGTTFNITRIHSRASAWNTALKQGASVAEVVQSRLGETYFFDSNKQVLYLKAVDTYDSRAPINFTVGGATVPGLRGKGSLYFNVTATIPGCTVTDSRFPQFCAMTGDANTYIPDAITATYDQFHLPYCAEIAPPQSVCTSKGVSSPNACTCAALRQAGKCADLAPSGSWLSPSTAFTTLAARAGGYCAATCGRCEAGQQRCMDQRVPRQLARALGAPANVVAEVPSPAPAPDQDDLCAWLAEQDHCYMTPDVLYLCRKSCGTCADDPVPCGNRVPGAPNTQTCKQLVSANLQAIADAKAKNQTPPAALCDSASWKTNNYCRGACGKCS